MAEPRELMIGAIEGFYGEPWSQAERFQLFDWMGAWGLNTYLYAPKDDLKHRALWRELYSPEEAANLHELVDRSKELGLRFIYGIGPGLDISYTSPADLDALKARLAQMIGIGCQSFALLFDDIPDRMSATDAAAFGSFAAAHARLANTLLAWLREQAVNPRLLFCPTPYCGRMAQTQLGGADYLETIGRKLAPEIDLFWTGPEIISERITVTHLRELQARVRRKPVIWDNLHANDYDGRRFYCGPYSGRDTGIRQEVSGLLANPNNEFPLNFVPLRTLGRFAATERWNAREEFVKALREWLPAFATVRQPINFEQLLAFADCFYLPHEDGPEAQHLERSFREDPAEFTRRAALIKEFCARVTELKDRALFYALSRRVWELREEIDLLERFLDWQGPGPFRSDFHLPQTYRGGFVPKLQKLLVQQPDGSFLRA